MLTGERQYVSQYATDVLGLHLVSSGQAKDADANNVRVTVANLETGAVILDHDATRAGIGDYRIQLTSAQSAEPGDYLVRWHYTISGDYQYFDTFMQIGVASPAYDALAPGMKEIVDQVWIRFADLFDSPDGGPHLQTYFQSRFNRGRVAQLLRVAVGRLNTVAQPHQSYTIDGDGGASFPTLSWGPLLEQALYVETLKHLRRSYVEQPDFQGATVARLDRRDYMQRWGEILEDEEADLKSRLATFKIGNMGLGRPAVLVSGGVYGRYAPTRYAGSAAARGRFWTRMF
jgi:hypothetical protein